MCVYAVYALVLTLFPAQRYLALATTAIATLNPSFLYSSALVSNDIPLVAFCTLALLAEAKILTHAWKPDWKAFAILGLWLALALMTKTTALGLLGLSFLVVLYIAWEQRGTSALNFGFLVTRGIAVAAPILVFTGWYFVRNQVVYGDPLAYRLIAASALPAREAPLTLPELFIINLPWLWQTFWGGPTPGDFPARAVVPVSRRAGCRRDRDCAVSRARVAWIGNQPVGRVGIDACVARFYFCGTAAVYSHGERDRPGTLYVSRDCDACAGVCARMERRCMADWVARAAWVFIFERRARGGDCEHGVFYCAARLCAGYIYRARVCFANDD